MDVTAKQVGEFLAYGTAVAYAFFKIFQNLWQFLKKIFGKNDSSTKKDSSTGSNITVNVDTGSETTPISQTQQDLIYHTHQLMRLLLEQGNLYRTLDKLWHNTLKEQMDFFDKHIDLFKLKLSKLASEMIKDGSEDSWFNVKNFENFIETGENRVKTKYRQMCKENHFTEKSPNEFRELCDYNSKIIIGIASDLLNNKFTQKNIKNDFYKKIIELKRDFEYVIIMCLNQAREVAESKEEKANELIKEFECKVTKLTGEPFKLNLYDE